MRRSPQAFTQHRMVSAVLEVMYVCVCVSVPHGTVIEFISLYILNDVSGFEIDVLFFLCGS